MDRGVRLIVSLIEISVHLSTQCHSYVQTIECPPDNATRRYPARFSVVAAGAAAVESAVRPSVRMPKD